MKICVIGAGIYGSYIINALLTKYPQTYIDLFEVGDSPIKSEEEIGYKSFLKKTKYKGLTDGRFFGFGGTSARWGGQLLTFTHNDFAEPSSYLKDIVQLDEKYKELVFKKFRIKHKYKENVVDGGLFTKTGVWLSYFRRDLYKHFKIDRYKNVNVIKHARVIRIESKDKKKIAKIIYKQGGCEKEAVFDYYFLSAGAFECARILLNSQILPTEKALFSDHLTQKVFKIKNGTMIGDEDFVFRIIGTSSITKRFVGEIDNCSFYVHPVINTEFRFFQSLKVFLFKKQFSFYAVKSFFVNIPETIAFVYSILVKRKMYILNNEFDLYIDIENPSHICNVRLSEEKDKFGEPGLDVYYSIGEKSAEIYAKVKDLVRRHLIKTNTDFEEYSENISVDKCEGTNHPYGMFCDFNSVEDYFNKYDNMLVVSTGILPRTGGINPTCAVLPLVEEFVNKYMPYFN